MPVPRLEDDPEDPETETEDADDEDADADTHDDDDDDNDDGAAAANGDNDVADPDEEEEGAVSRVLRLADGAEALVLGTELAVAEEEEGEDEDIDSELAVEPLCIDGGDGAFEAASEPRGAVLMIESMVACLPCFTSCAALCFATFSADGRPGPV